MWKYFVERGKPRITIWRMRIACCIPKATDVHSEYAIPITLPLQQWLHESASVLRHTYIVCVLSDMYMCTSCILFYSLYVNHVLNNSLIM